MKKILKNLYTIAIIAFAAAHYSSAYAADYVIPSGQTVGIKIYTEGVIVAGTAEFADADGHYVCPARDAGIKKGDVIKSINDCPINSCEDLADIKTGDAVSFEVLRENEALSVSVLPKKAQDGEYRIGIWARDSTAGIGTMTFINPKTLRYTALGHAVTDIDTGNIMTVNKGNIQSCEIISITKGHIGFPGSVAADFGSDEMGDIDTNGDNGISGNINEAPQVTATEVAEVSEIHSGSAYVLSDVAGNGIKEYTAEVEIISEDGVRNMVVEITDSELIEATGGIVQGMSGAPIMQDGKLIGAVTHVFINDPRKGYAIFAKNLAE